MTIGLLKEICREHNIPDDAVIKSDSGWECGETDTNGVYYSESENQIVLTQRGEEYETWHQDPDYKVLCSKPWNSDEYIFNKESEE